MGVSLLLRSKVRVGWALLLVGAGATVATNGCYADDPCVAEIQAFDDEVWKPLLSPRCVGGCHIPTGLAGGSALLFNDGPRAGRLNLKIFQFYAPPEGSEGQFLEKARGGLNHGGGAPVRPGDGEYERLKAAFARFRGVDCPP